MIKVNEDGTKMIFGAKELDYVEVDGMKRAYADVVIPQALIYQYVITNTSAYAFSHVLEGLSRFKFVYPKYAKSTDIIGAELYEEYNLIADREEKLFNEIIQAIDSEASFDDLKAEGIDMFIDYDTNKVFFNKSNKEDK